MRTPRKQKRSHKTGKVTVLNETVSFEECAATSVRPPKAFAACTDCTVGEAGTTVLYRGKFLTVEYNAGFVGLDGRHWVKVNGGHVPCWLLV